MTVARREAGDRSRLTGRPTDPTGFFHVRRARLMPSRIRSALVLPLIVGCQVGLTLGALALCDVRTGRGLLDLMVITSGNPDSWPQRWWDLYFYRGYPV